MASLDSSRTARAAALNIDAEVAAMRRMTVDQLRDKYCEVFGEPSFSRHKEYLIKRIAWRMQANEYGGLSERALARARELANPADLRVTAPRPKANVVTIPVESPADNRLPPAGTVINRPYKGRDLEVRVLANGFEFEGEIYKTLSAVAKHITGQHVNGFHFFRLPKRGEE